jgi:hypothetical protein
MEQSRRRPSIRLIINRSDFRAWRGACGSQSLAAGADRHGAALQGGLFESEVCPKSPPIYHEQLKTRRPSQKARYPEHFPRRSTRIVPWSGSPGLGRRRGSLCTAFKNARRPVICGAFAVPAGAGLGRRRAVPSFRCHSFSACRPQRPRRVRRLRAPSSWSAGCAFVLRSIGLGTLDAPL